MTITDVSEALVKKGFTKQREDRHDLVFKTGGKSGNIIFMRAKYKSPLKQSAKKDIAEQLNISVAFFEDMVECHKGQNDYEAELHRYRANYARP
ncbi:MAG: hypothetical protein ORN98_05555 [Alphaproteobacteria bacterium]|nr:hypothetical protein [Alphaproteobacteria bacterium]